MSDSDPPQEPPVEPAASPPPSRWQSVLWLIAIVVLAAAPYLHTLDNGFAFDDRIIVLINGKKWHDDTLWQLIRHDYWGDQRIDSLYRPITTVSLVWNYRLSQDRPRSYRIINILLHVACCLCLFGLTLAVFGNLRLAGLTGVLFAIHAIHVEAVEQIVGRAELLSALFTLAALWLYVADRRRRRTNPTWRYALVLLLAGMSMLSKESGMALIGLIVLYDLWGLRYGKYWTGKPFSENASPPRTRSMATIRKLALRRWLGLLLVAMAVLALRADVLGRITRDRDRITIFDNPVVAASPAQRAMTAVVLFGKYVRLLVWPHPLCHDYSYNALPICRTITDERFAWGLACLAAMAVGAVCSWRGRGAILACVGFFLTTYFLVSNAVVLIGTIFAERLMYVPSVALCWAAAIGAVAVLDRAARQGLARAGTLIVATVVVAIGGANVYLTVQRGLTCKSERLMVADALRLSGNSARLRMQAGAYAVEDKDLDAATRHFTRVLELLPDHAYAHYMLAKIRMQSGQPAQAVPHLLQCVGKLPREFRPMAARLLAAAYQQLNQPDQANLWLQRAKQIETPAH
ncbi:MAG: DUF1736 domain-containing protein [Phycisphaerae bacterium]|nr:DUF1736 domain-containing protein [Phycisphaerae bacterium]